MGSILAEENGNLGASKDFTNYNNFVGRRKLEGKSGAREKKSLSSGLPFGLLKAKSAQVGLI